MIIKKIFSYIALILVMGLALTACTQEKDSSGDIPYKTENGFYVYPVDFKCTIPGYDDEGKTRAMSYDWYRNTSIFARFQSGLTYYHGFLTFDGNEWHIVSTNDFLSLTSSGSVELFYFQDSNGDYYYMNVDTQCLDIYNNGSFVKSTSIKWNIESFDISEGTAVYIAPSASYQSEYGRGSINAKLDPAMWRMRFSGANGTTITMPATENDIQYASSFNRSTEDYSFTGRTKDISLKVSNNYTPYIYGKFSSTSNKITVRNGNDTYTRNLNASNLPVGKSGCFTIPTSSNYSSLGWTKVSSSSLSVTPTSLDFTESGGSQTVTVSCNESWTVTSNQTWCTVSPTKGSKDGTITITVKENTGASRTSTITITAIDNNGKTLKDESGKNLVRTVAVTQKAASETPKLIVNPTTMTFEAKNANVQEAIITNESNLRWKYSVNKDWIHINHVDTYYGYMSVTVEDNPSSEREGIITITAIDADENPIKDANGNRVTATIRVIQKGGGGGALHTTASPESLTFEADGGNLNITVTSNEQWYVTLDNKTWCSVSPSSGSNSGTVKVTAKANTSTEERYATVKITGNSSGDMDFIYLYQKAKDEKTPGENDNPLPQYSRKRK